MQLVFEDSGLHARLIGGHKMYKTNNIVLNRVAHGYNPGGRDIGSFQNSLDYGRD